jgi:hypothetical protein
MLRGCCPFAKRIEMYLVSLHFASYCFDFFAILLQLFASKLFFRYFITTFSFHNTFFAILLPVLPFRFKTFLRYFVPTFLFYVPVPFFATGILHRLFCFKSLYSLFCFDFFSLFLLQAKIWGHPNYGNRDSEENSYR